MEFDLKNQVVVITGGAGLLGFNYAKAIAEHGGIPILWDIDEKKVKQKAEEIKKTGRKALGFKVDITSEKEIEKNVKMLLEELGRIDVLINNAANNPKIDKIQGKESTRLENFPLKNWDADLSVGLTGAFLCSRIIGKHMAKNGKGVILNISSDLGIIAPDQRLYKKKGISDDKQPVKPVTYSVVKHGIIGLTRYLATYWCKQGVRANAFCPGGVYNNQPDDFVKKVTDLIPLGRMAKPEDYNKAVLFLISDASSYMNGSVVAMDGGRTCW